jgi:tetratricopeptide (TPR) repeat protein
MAREVVFRRGEATALVYLGLLSHCLGDNEAAQEHSRQALLVARDIGERDLQGRALTNLGHALAGLGHRAEAAELYQQALTLRRELGQRALAMESLTGLADVSLTQRDLARAQTQVEEILSYLETNTLAGTEEPFRIYLTCYRILQANQDSRARTILDTAYHLLQERAAKISDEDVRRMFLENVAAHREIIGEFAKSQETTEDRRRTTDDKSGA